MLGLAEGPPTGTAAVLADAGRAVALLDDEAQPPEDPLTGYVLSASAFDTLQLWELAARNYASRRPPATALAQRLTASCRRDIVLLLLLDAATALAHWRDEQQPAAVTTAGRLAPAPPPFWATRRFLLWGRAQGLGRSHSIADLDARATAKPISSTVPQPGPVDARSRSPAVASWRRRPRACP